MTKLFDDLTTGLDKVEAFLAGDIWLQGHPPCRSRCQRHKKAPENDAGTLFGYLWFLRAMPSSIRRRPAQPRVLGQSLSYRHRKESNRRDRSPASALQQQTQKGNH